ncbi:16S rRNA (cytidine(1402)-2'-O)-methyltransferase [Salibacterium salarium]|uniref:Ribosomal RNA small subunit methyltransferase I n=1 Tax=Salibacterium salarium TaxID=284579 RepID=A0A3R9P3P7_9BACI|nr:16S rRNA (cytidine(1402)-2'-O)-methyltransferase [Salibacterium salarium]RSL29582.1 16S rRNA (cytidine(1402)-2'-O)-methyltransferase [Salibacterium salarium]
MINQKSFQTEDNVVLYLVPTPIGNLEDMTFRAVRILQEVDVIFAEDTRQTRKLCSHFEISTFLDSYHEHNKDKKGDKILSLLTEGKKIALVSDAGTPLVSDPGKEVVDKVLQEGIAVISLPGANAAVTALTASGLGGGPFYFYGFLPRKKKDREVEIRDLSYVKAPLVFYESPHRLTEMVNHLEEWWKDRQIVLAREITKKFEELVRGTVAELKEYLEQESIKGECCLIVEGAALDEKRPEENWWVDIDMVTHVHRYMEQNLSSKEAIKETAKERGLSKRDVYAAYHNL